MEMIIIIVEVVVDRKKFLVEIKIENDHDQGKIIINNKSPIFQFL
jgi:hypothetical protein